MKEQRRSVECFGLMCTLCIIVRLARPREEANPHHATVIEEANPHHEEATIVFEDAFRQKTLIRTVQQHVAVYNNNNCRLPGKTRPLTRPMKLPESSDVVNAVRSLAGTRVFVHRPSNKNLSGTSLFLQIAPGSDKSLGYVVFIMSRISHLHNANRAVNAIKWCPRCSKGSKVVKTTLPVLCWSCISAALKSVTIWSNSTQCHLLRHEYPDVDNVDSGNCVLRNGAMFLPLQSKLLVIFQCMTS